jgi:hypothetical protein
MSCPEDSSASRKATDYERVRIHRSNATRTISVVIGNGSRREAAGSSGPRDPPGRLAGSRVLLPVHVIEHRADNAADDSAFGGLPHFAPRRHIFLQLVGETGDGQRLQPDATRPGERGEEDAIASEDEIFNAADHGDLERNARGEGADVAWMDEQGLALLQVAGDDLAGELEPCGVPDR